MLKVLELFSGTGSIGKVCKEVGYSSLSLDLELEADININIMDWDYKKYPKDSFDIIWASPPCVYYSRLQYCWLGRKKKKDHGEITTHETIERDRKEQDKLIKRTFEIIEYFQPHYWFMENPLSCLKDRDVMKDKPYYVVDYCKYCDWGYRKRTCIWTNREDFIPLKCHNDCDNLIKGTKKHLKSVDGGKKGVGKQGRTDDILERYRIPPELIYSLLL